MQALVYDPSAWRWILCKLGGVFRKDVYWSHFSGLQYRKIDAPNMINGEWVRLKTILGGVCGTDLAMLTQRVHPASYLAGMSSFPMILGHENVAMIDEVGDSVPGWQKGERVVVEPALGCAARGIQRKCRSCQAGKFSLCEKVTSGKLPPGSMIGLNAFTGGSWAPYFVAHYSQLHRVPASMEHAHALLVDPLACALHGVLRHRPRSTDRVLVVGSGIIGLGVVAILRALGARSHITAIARHGFQKSLLLQLGADVVLQFSRRQSRRQQYDEIAQQVAGKRVDGRFGNYGFLGGFNVVYDCVGSGSSITDSLKWTRARGTTVLLGTSNITLLDTTPIWNKELNVVGCYGRQMETTNGQPLHTYEILFHLIKKERLPMELLPVKVFKPHQYHRAFASMTGKRRSNVVKVAFTFS